MSDSVKKYFEMVEEGLIEEKDSAQPKLNLDESIKSKAYSILISYPSEAILEAARILKSGE